MRLANRAALITPFLSLGLTLFTASLPLMAMAVEFKPPQRGIPGRREGGGTRDPIPCTQGTPNRLTALMPQTNLGLTTAAYPRFFWFMPKTRAKLAEFTLVEVDPKLAQAKVTDQKWQEALDAALASTNPVYKTTFSITGTSGIASLALPSNANIPPLTVGKDYYWSVSLICNSGKSTIKVNGWVQRVTPDANLTAQLLKANPSDRVTLYASNGYWFDTIDTLANLRCLYPKEPSLKTGWSQLLQSVKLNAIADQPLMQNCGE